MQRTRQNFLIFLLLVMTIGYGYWFLKPSQPMLKQNMSKNAFDSLITNVHWIEFDERGDVSQEFFSPEIRGYANQDFYDIMTPLFRLTREKDSWEIHSDFAKAYHQSDQIDLNENVLIKHQIQNHPTPAILKTQHLKYLVKKQIATTKHHVTIEQGSNVLHSEGMVANFSETQTLKLGHVLGQYLPEEHPKS